MTTTSTTSVPRLRVAALNDAPLRPDGAFVLHWMTAARRPRRNFALDRSVALARSFGRPVLVLEALRCDAPWSSARIHRFVLDGMGDNRRAFEAAGVAYHAYVEPRPGDGKGLVAALAASACAVVTDEFPCGFLPRMASAAARDAPVRFEAVDGNGLLPLRAADRAYPTAYAFRRHLQQRLLPHLAELPSEDPFAGAPLPRLRRLPEPLLTRWTAAPDSLLVPGADLGTLPVDRSVAPAPSRGGASEARRVLAEFVERRLGRYAEDRNDPDVDGTSGLSPWLHFGHVGAHEVFLAVAEHERWAPQEPPPRTTGSREGWWGTGSSAEAFLDQLVTWRELSSNTSFHRPDDHDRWESLPAWARATLDRHRPDPRVHVYSPGEFDGAATHDPLWNAAQRQLVREGRIHNSLRMLWGKKVIEWSPSPEDALATMIHLNDRYALDGRDPNSYAGILWCLGRHDRPWGPERPVFGTVRWMSSDSAARKLRLVEYLRRHAG